MTGLQCACATARQVARVLTQLYDLADYDAVAGLEAPAVRAADDARETGPMRSG